MATTEKPETMSTGPRQLGSTAAIERHYSVQEIAALWQVSDDTVRRTFAREPGVLTIGRGGRALLRVPESVLSRVHNRMSNGKRG